MKFQPGSPGGYVLYGGDVNQDGIVDLSDLVIISNGASNFQTGYVVADANGDSIVDLADMVLTQNNSSIFVAKVTP